MLQTLLAYRYAAAMATLDKWLLLSDSASTVRVKLTSRANGVVWHDRYLCGDAENGRKAPRR